MKVFRSALPGFLLTVALLAAQDFSDKPPVMMAPPGNVQVRPGSTKNLTLDFRINSEYHINSHTPKSALLIPTVLKLEPTQPVSVADLKYPEGKDVSFAFTGDEKLNVYSGDFSIDAKLKVPPGAHAGTYPVKGELRFQACDHSACLPPRTIPVQFQVTVVK